VLEISDGQIVWPYTSNSNAYIKTPWSGNPRNDELDRLKFSRDPASFHDAAIQRDETLEFAGQKVPCYVVRASYRSMPDSPGAHDLTRTVWIAKSNDQILRDMWDYTASAAPLLVESKVRVTTGYSVIEAGIPLAADRFLFSPPPGAGCRATIRRPPGCPARP
jgi:outer membrane lipoprotein-sorting protein